ncbi:MAG TPA: type VI secretion system baseplate subunit TssG [Phycisphaerales bacterium]|jgi:type VI secretion system protein ImpH|nr:type VI secretion system baseplate subunit TssG [Phycisphaerales bacterium]
MAAPAPDPVAPERSAHDLIPHIADPDQGWDFFYALRCLQASRPDLPPIGKSGLPDQDAVRFSQHVSLSFPPTSMAGLGAPVPRPRAQEPAPRIKLNHFGLLSPAGPFPLHITRFIRRRERHHADPAAARFFDLFNHRMACLFFRAWAINNIAVSQDRPAENRFSDYVGALCGYGTPSLQKRTTDEGAPSRAGHAPGVERDAVPLNLKLHFAGRLMCPSRHPEGLAAILASFLGVRVRIREFIPRWIPIPPESHTRLTGRIGLVPGPRLGGRQGNIIIGERIFECQSLFRIVIGPVSFALYKRLIPGQPGMAAVRDWIRNYLGHQADVQIQVVLASSEVPRARLGAGGASQLGTTAWVASGASAADRGDLILEHTH